MGEKLNASTIKTGNALIDGTEDYSANSKTVFIVEGGTASNPTYTAYTGIANVPGMTGAEGEIYVKDGVAAFVYITKSTLTGSASEKLTYISFEGADAIEDETGEYLVCNAVVDGEITTVKVDAASSTVKESEGNLYKSLTYSKDNIITDGTPAAEGEDEDYLQVTGTTADNDGLLVLGGASYGYVKDVVVFKVDDEGAITGGAISDIETDINDVVLFTRTPTAPSTPSTCCLPKAATRSPSLTPSSAPWKRASPTRSTASSKWTAPTSPSPATAPTLGSSRKTRVK